MDYSTPQLRTLGSLTDLTLGTGGSSLDGGARNNTQRGSGNDGRGPATP